MNTTLQAYFDEYWTTVYVPQLHTLGSPLEIADVYAVVQAAFFSGALAYCSLLRLTGADVLPEILAFLAGNTGGIVP